jgi:hypothetical protein
MDLKFIYSQKIKDSKGKMSVFEVGTHLPFMPKRIIAISDTPHGEFRGGHANRVQKQLFIAAAGSFDLHVRVPGNKKVIVVSGHETAVYVGPLVWREVRNISRGGTCLLISSMIYGDRSDYIDDWEEFADLWRKAYR